MWMMPPRRRELAGFSHPILGREPDAHFLTWMMPLCRRELSPGFSHSILGRELDDHFLMWMMPPGFLLSHYPIGPVASPRCVARSSYYFWEIRGSLRCVFPTPNIWDLQLTSDHLTQARAILKPVRPSGHSPNDAAIYAYIPSPLAKSAVTRANAKLPLHYSDMQHSPISF
jgi:hypothetical protein